MDNKLFKLNMTFAIADTVICLFTIAAFSIAAFIFDHWWIVMFNLLPLFAFTSHTLVINNDLIAAEEDQGEEVKSDE